MTVIYCDYAASTPLDPKVQQVMEKNKLLGNAASEHYYGLQGRRRIEQAKKSIASLIHAQEPSDIVLTSGATESINMVLKGVALQQLIQGSALPHIVISAIEHKATLDTCKQLHGLGCKITKIPVDHQGCLDMSALRQVLKEKPLLFSLMHINSEIGSIQPIEEVAALLKETSCLFHIDAAQSVGKIPLDVRKLAVDFLSFSSHKLYGPQGIGALYVKPGSQHHLQPLISGGGHQQGLRSGTLPTNLVVGFGMACEQGQQQWQKDVDNARVCRKQVMDKLLSLKGVRVLGDETTNYPGILSLCIENVHGHMLAGLLQEQVAFSVGSACTSHFHEPSHVLQAMTVGDACINSTIRLSFGRFSTLEEMDKVGALLCKGIQQLRACHRYSLPHYDQPLSSGTATLQPSEVTEKTIFPSFFVDLKRKNMLLTLQCTFTKGQHIEKLFIYVFSTYAGWLLKTFLEDYLKNQPVALLKKMTANFLMEKTQLAHKDFEVALLFEEGLQQLWQQWENNHE